MNGLKFVAIPIACLLCLCFALQPVNAHRLHMEIEEDVDIEIEIKIYYGDGSPAKDAEVTVTFPNGTTYIEGRTDDEGVYKFYPNASVADNLTVTAKQAGHQVKKVVILEGCVVQGEEEEWPLYAKIFAGLGYLVGIGGVASLIIARRMKKSEVVRNDSL